MANIYLQRGLAIKKGTIDEVELSGYYPDPSPPPNTSPYYPDQKDGDIIISPSIFAKLIDGVWRSIYNSKDHCTNGPHGAPGSQGMTAYGVPVGFTSIRFIRGVPNYNVNCRLRYPYTIVNLNDGKAYEMGYSDTQYKEVPEKRMSNG